VQNNRVSYSFVTHFIEYWTRHRYNRFFQLLVNFNVKITWRYSLTHQTLLLSTWTYIPTTHRRLPGTACLSTTSCAMVRLASTFCRTSVRLFSRRLQCGVRLVVPSGQMRIETWLARCLKVLILRSHQFDIDVYAQLTILCNNKF